MKLSKVIEALEEFAPLHFQEDYDNSGLMLGDRNSDVSKALICLDVTDEIIDEAIREKCDLIISHHPLIFNGIKKLTGSCMQERILVRAIKHELAIYAFHTNLDNVFYGVNFILAEKIGLKQVSILAPKRNLLRKLVTFCPLKHAEQVRNALFQAGAGHIGDYDCCSYNVDGKGTFRAGNNTNPFIGEKGQIHFEEEIKIETIFPAYLEKKILKSLFESHPYEEVAYDIFILSNIHHRVGAGMIGTLEEEMDELPFLRMVKDVLDASCIRHSRLIGKKIKNVAICGGAGSFLIRETIAMGADVLITSDVKYHQFFEADNNILIADVGHYESEQFSIELIFNVLKKKFPKFALRISSMNTNAIHYLK